MENMPFENWETLATAIQSCNNSCVFRNPNIPPLAPKEVRVPVPVMFIGENPSWAEEQREPFAPGTVSGDALENHYLKPLKLHRDEVWITDLIKCRYPSKNKWPGYPKDIYKDKTKYAEDIQEVAQQCSTLWLVKEIELARPKILVTLSNTQVYQQFRRIFRLRVPRSFKDAVGRRHDIEVEGFSTILFPMVHPDVSRPEGDGDNRKLNVRMKWAPLHRNHIETLKQLL